MPRKITHPYTRETALMEEGKPALIVLTPPGNSIGFRPKHGRITYPLSMKRAYALAKQDAGVKVITETKVTHAPEPKVYRKPKGDCTGCETLRREVDQGSRRINQYFDRATAVIILTRGASMLLGEWDRVIKAEVSHRVMVEIRRIASLPTDEEVYKGIEEIVSTLTGQPFSPYKETRVLWNIFQLVTHFQRLEKDKKRNETPSLPKNPECSSDQNTCKPTPNL